MASNNNQNIQVVVRCRPLSVSERKNGSHSVVETNSDRKEVLVRERHIAVTSTKAYHYDRVFGPNSKQIEVYKSVVVPILDEVLLGYNCTVFAYGQTGTGKTFTMEGERSQKGSHTWEDDPLAGIVPRAMHQLFGRLQRIGGEFSVRVSYMELYNEELIDLLGAESVENPRLKIYEDKKGACVIQGLEEVAVMDKDQVYTILEKGSARRQTAATLMNSHSSRSHSVFMVTIHTKENSIDGEELLRTGKLNLVDLAGSECIGRSGAVERRAREAGNINQSLLTLGRVITALVEHAPHVPYRESKLTRLLQDSLGGRTKTCIIATISPAHINLEETLCTLDYVHRAKNIMNRPEINQKTTKKALLKEYTEEIERLRRDLQANRDKNGIYMAEENYNAMQTQINQQGDNINDMTEKIAALNAEILKVMDLFSDAKEELCEKTEQLAATAESLRQTEDALSDTRATLRVTRRHCDEQRHLVSVHVDTEATLHSEASQLLQTAASATDDVSALHDKVDRTRAVDRDNTGAADAFRENLAAAAGDMQRHLQQFSETRRLETADMCTAIDNLVSERTLASDHVTSALRTVIDSVTRNGAALHSSQVSHDAATSRRLSGLERVCLDAKEAENTRVGIFESGALVQIENGIAHLQTAEQNLRQLAEQLKEQARAQQERVEAFTAQIDAAFSQQEAALQRILDAQSEHLQKQTEHVQAVRQTQRDVSKKLSDDFLKKMNLFMSEMIAQQQTELDVGTEKVLTSLGEYQEIGTELTAEATRQLQTHRDRNIQHSAEFIRCTDDHNRDNDCHIEQIGKEMAVSMTTTAEIQKQLSKFAVEGREVMCDMTDQVSSLVAEHNAAATVELEQHSADTKALVFECRQQLDAVHSERAQNDTQMNASLGAHRRHLVESGEATTAWAEGMASRVAEMEAVGERFVTSELRENIPTGLTPARRDFHYPRTLTTTDRHSLLLSNFRDTYDLVQAINTPIPEDSFTEPSPSSQVMDAIMAAETSGSAVNTSGASPKLLSNNNNNSSSSEKHNTSSDSAISSSASVTSSTDRKMVTINDTNPATVDKENTPKMPPPSAPGKTRAGTATTSRSARTQSSRTPTPQKASRQAKPATASKTPGSSSRVRAKLPLKTSNP